MTHQVPPAITSQQGARAARPARARLLAPLHAATLALFCTLALAGCTKEENPWEGMTASGATTAAMNPGDYALTLDQMLAAARDLANKDKFEEAEANFLAATAEAEKRGACDALYLSLLREVAYFYYFKGRYIEAVRLFETLRDTRERCVGPDHPDLAEDLQNLANVYAFRSNFQLAEPAFLRAIAIREKTAPDSAELGRALKDYADMLRKADRPTEAAPFDERSNAILARP